MTGQPLQLTPGELVPGRDRVLVNGGWWQLLAAKTNPVNPVRWNLWVSDSRDVVVINRHADDRLTVDRGEP